MCYIDLIYNLSVKGVYLCISVCMCVCVYECKLLNVNHNGSSVSLEFYE